MRDPGDRTFTSEEGDLVRGPSTPLVELIESFRVNNESRLTARTLRGYLHTLRAYDLHQGGPRLADFTAEAVNRYVADKMRTHPPAARLAAATLRAFASWLHATGITASSDGRHILAGVPIPRVDRERTPFSDREYELVLRALEKATHRTRARDRALVLTLLATGLRLNELRELRLPDVHIERPLERSYLVVREETSKRTANTRDREVRIDPIAAVALHNYIRDWRPPALPEGPLFLIEREPARGFTYEGFKGYMGRIADSLERAGVRDFMAHRCRHFWATTTHRAGSTETDLAQEGGWVAGSPVVKRYTKFRPFAELQRKPTALSYLARERAS